MVKVVGAPRSVITWVTTWGQVWEPAPLLGAVTSLLIGKGPRGASSHCVAEPLLLPRPQGPHVAQEETGWKTFGDMCPFGVGVEGKAIPIPSEIDKPEDLWEMDPRLGSTRGMPSAPRSCLPHFQFLSTHPLTSSGFDHAAHSGVAQVI